jgi:isocitrate lyase
MIAHSKRYELAAFAIADCRYIPEDGRSTLFHLDVVWCNYSDAFDDARQFLSGVSAKFPGTEIGKVANSLLSNGVRTELMR